MNTQARVRVVHQATKMAVYATNESMYLSEISKARLIYK